MSKAVVMAGGLGTRLRPLTYAIPKPLVPVGKRPILEIILRQFARAGFDDVYVAVGYKSELITANFGDGSDLGVKITYVKEEERRGTVGALTLMPDMLDEPFLMINGDILTKLDFRAMFEAHAAGDADVTMGVKRHHVELPYGVLTLADGSVTQFIEKPVESFPVAVGVYCLNPSIIDMIPTDERYDMPELIGACIAAGKTVAGYDIGDVFWTDIADLSDFEHVNVDAEQWDV